MQKDGFYGGYTPGWFDYALRNRRLVQKYNSLPWEDLKGKYEVLKELLAQCDEKTLIEPPFRCDHGENIYIGKNFYAKSKRMLRTCEMFCPKDRIGQIKITRIFTDFFYGTCKIRVTTCSENADSIKLSHFDYKSVLNEIYKAFDIAE